MLFAFSVDQLSIYPGSGRAGIIQNVYLVKMEPTNSLNTALLVMDVQAATVSMLKDTKTLFLGALAKTVNSAREHRIPVIFVVVGFRKDYPEVSADNKSFAILKGSGRNFDTAESMTPDPHITPLGNEIVIVKKRVSAFAGSDLEIVLRSKGIRHLVLTGIATSGVVLSTVREAADMDFKITVIADCCADADDEVHRVLTTKVFPRQADVVTHDHWIK